VERGEDPNRWLDVKENLPKLAIRKWHSVAPHGYARGWEPVQYVSNIRTYYEILNWLTPNQQEKGKESDNTNDQSEFQLQTAARDSLLNWF
jgi:membrane-bound lytic murein transglycosylase F